MNMIRNYIQNKGERGEIGEIGKRESVKEKREREERENIRERARKGGGQVRAKTRERIGWKDGERLRKGAHRDKGLEDEREWTNTRKKASKIGVRNTGQYESSPKGSRGGGAGKSCFVPEVAIVKHIPGSEESKKDFGDY
jgi:hypothetical protein